VQKQSSYCASINSAEGVEVVASGGERVASSLVERLGSDHDGRPVVVDLDSRSDTRLLVPHISDAAATMERQTTCRDKEEGVREHLLPLIAFVRMGGLAAGVAHSIEFLWPVLPRLSHHFPSHAPSHLVFCPPLPRVKRRSMRKTILSLKRTLTAGQNSS
jgi:hypothetical protein